jgi:hypothetical protein
METVTINPSALNIGFILTYVVLDHSSAAEQHRRRPSHPHFNLADRTTFDKGVGAADCLSPMEEAPTS